MAENSRVICTGSDVLDSGKGIRFVVERYGRETPAFVVRFKGKAHAFLNECGHVPVELDWQPGEFFDDSGLYLICSVHGALYSPETGRCLGGRCNGKGLKPVAIEERDGTIYLNESASHG